VEARRILVLAVDRDDDLGRAGLHTPIIGRRAVLNAAIKYAELNPEDADLNVLFAAIKLVDELREKGVQADVAVVSGHPTDSIEADMRIRNQTLDALRRTRTNAIILVSDGAEDELVLPILQGLAPVVSVKRVIVEQHRGVEETYMLIAKYIKKAIEEPRYARLFLGVPGLILIVFSALALLGLLYQAILAGLLVLGITMVIRGFNLEHRLMEVLRRTPALLIAYIVAGLALASAIALAYYEFTLPNIPEPIRIARVLKGVAELGTFSAWIVLITHAIAKIISGSMRIAKEIIGLTASGVLLFLISMLANAIQKFTSVSLATFIAAMLESNFVIYALAGIIGVTVAWRLAVALENLLEERKEKS